MYKELPKGLIDENGKKLFDNYTHIRIMHELAMGLKAVEANDKYLELGISKAKCFFKCAPYFKRALAVDINPDVKNRFSSKNFERQKVDFSNTSWKFFPMTTDDFFRQNKERDFDFIFVDAKHSFEQARKDFENSWPLLKMGALMVLHDTYVPNREYLQHCEDCWKLPVWIKEQNYIDLELMTLPFYMGLTLIRKRNKQVIWM